MPARSDAVAGRDASPSKGQSLATRAARFRNGAPFLVERATLYDPYPLDPLPVVEVTTLPRQRPRRLLPVALTLLGVVVVVGLAAGVLFVRNADAPRHGEQAGRAAPSRESAAPRSGPGGGPQGGVAYDLTRRPSDAIIGAWRQPKELEKQIERAPPPPARVTEPPVAAAPPVPEEPRRSLPRRLSMPRAAPANEGIAEPTPTARAPLDEPHVPKAVTEVLPKAATEGPPKGVIEDPPLPPQQAPQQANERPGPNVVARVGRESDQPDAEDRRRQRGGAPIGPDQESAREPVPKSGKGGRMSRESIDEKLRRMRKAKRDAEDLDRFLLRDAGDIPKGFTYSGPQGQRP